MTGSASKRGCVVLDSQILRRTFGAVLTSSVCSPYCDITWQKCEPEPKYKAQRHQKPEASPIPILRITVGTANIMMSTFFNYNGFVSLLLLLWMSNRVEGGAFVGRAADALFHRGWAAKNHRPVDHLLFSTIHHPDNGDESLFFKVAMQEHKQQQESPFSTFPVFPAAVSVVLLSVLLTAASLGHQDAALLDMDSQINHPSQSASSRQDTTTSTLQQQRQAQPAVEENQVVWMIDGSEGYFFF